MKYSKEEVYKNSLEYFNGDQMLADIWVNKYAITDSEGNFVEASPDERIKAISKEFERIENKYKNPLEYKEIYEALDHFKFIVPGGSLLYGIGNNHSYTSLGNCFVIQGPRDSYGDIIRADEEQVQIMKRRGGVGHDLSGIRPEGAPVSNSARTSTGVVPFMRRYSNSTREVAQGGRRGALMLTIDIRHPDVESFIKAKSSSLSEITGANISVRVTDDFIDRVLKNKDFYLRFPIDIDVIEDSSFEYGKLYRIGKGRFVKRVKARDIWNLLVDSAWRSAEPGVLFWDTVINNSIADNYYSFDTSSTNPCGEIPLCPYDSCRLMSVNMYNFVMNPFTDKATFDSYFFYEMVKRAQKLMDDVIDLEEEKIERILDKVRDGVSPNNLNEIKLWKNIQKKLVEGRRTGLSAIGLADTLAALGIKYGSDESIAFANFVFDLFKQAAYESSMEMGFDRGAFLASDDIKEDNKENKKLQEALKYKNRRNISLLTIPPSGTISLIAGVSSGIEPVYQLEYKRRRKIVDSIDKAEVTFVDETGDKWTEYVVIHPGLKKFLEVNPGKKIEDSPYFGATAHDIDPKARVIMQGTIQEHIDHSISSTVNLGKDTTRDDVEKIFLEAYKNGCKGITIYREGSREGVLISKDSGTTKFEQRDAPKRPKELDCEVHVVKSIGKEWITIVGLYEGKPYEVFSVLNNGRVTKKFSKGKIVKEAKGKYNLFIDNVLVIKDVTKDAPDSENTMTRLISTALRHGSDIKFIVEQLYKSKGDVTSFSKAIARTLSMYVNGEIKTGSDVCEMCGSTNIVHEGGCVTCLDCSYSKCG